MSKYFHFLLVGKEAEDAIAQNKADREAELERQEAAEDDTIEK